MQRLFRGEKKKIKTILCPIINHLTIPPRCRDLDLFHTHSGRRRMSLGEWSLGIQFRSRAPPTHTDKHLPDLGGSYKRFMKFMVENFQKWTQQQDCQVPCGHRQTEHPRISWGLTQTLDIQQDASTPKQALWHSEDRKPPIPAYYMICILIYQYFSLKFLW